MFRRHLLTKASVLLVASSALAADGPADSDYAAVRSIFTKYCVACHNAEDAKGKLVLESYSTLLKGGKRGAVVVPGRSGESRLLLMLEGKAKPRMPPGKRRRPREEELAVLKAWIDAGAKGPSSTTPAIPHLVTPKIVPRQPPRRAVSAVACSPDGELLAVARYGEVELYARNGPRPAARLSGHRGAVNDVLFSMDGEFLVAAGGEPGLFGEARLWNVADHTLSRTIIAHKDALYAVALSNDRKILATGSYDKQIKLWDTDSGRELRTIEGHNAAVFSLAFRPDGKVLASASGDRTVKLWNPVTGERLDTFSESLKGLYALAFSPDGKRLAAGGMDNRVRVWRVSDAAVEGTNEILYVRFAHEGAILDLCYSRDGSKLISAADDRTVKVWQARTVEEIHLLERQPDWPSSLALAPDGSSLAVGRLDGSVGWYDVSSGRPLPPTATSARRGDFNGRGLPFGFGALAAALGLPTALPTALPTGAPPAKPELSSLMPRGVERGVTTRVKLEGKHLYGVTAVRSNHEGLAAKVLSPPGTTAAGGDTEAGETAGGAEKNQGIWISVTPAADLLRGAYELWVVSARGESGKLKLFVDDLPQLQESEPNDAAGVESLVGAPVSVWGAIGQRGDRDRFAIDARGGDTLVFDLGAQRLGSKLDAVLSVVDSQGRVVASNNDFEGKADPLLAYTIPESGRYRVQVDAQVLNGSPDHFYRLSVGAFRYVTGCYPLSVPANSESEVELVGFNLSPGARMRVNAGEPGEVGVPLDPEFFRGRRDLKVLVAGGGELLEAEPNDLAAQATPFRVPGSVGGRIDRAAGARDSDVDLFRFEAKKGEAWIIETAAARRGSPLDSRIDVLYPDGKPVERLLLQAVRDSYIHFRSIDSNSADVRVKNWEEMDLNQFLYFQGEVTKIFRMPRGPDSGFGLYTSGGKRRCYFDTSATTHANDSSCYIVLAHPPGARLVPNGLPVFRLYYANDDDGDRKLGSDSKLNFRAPADGEYLIRVSDVRGQGGSRYAYRLTVRRPQPDFRVSHNGANLTVNAGSGKGFTVSVARIDGFEGEVRVDISDVPAGFFVTTPLIIQAGHRQASGAVFGSPDARPIEKDSAPPRVTATAVIAGKKVTKKVKSLGKIKLAGKPKLRVRLFPWPGPAKPWDESRNWTVLEPTSFISLGGASMTKLADGSILAGGNNAATDVYMVAVNTELEGIRAFRLEVLGDPSLPGGGPGRAPESGSFVLSEFRVSAMSRGGNPGKARPVLLERASADHSRAGSPVAGTLDGKHETGWSVDQNDLKAAAVFEVKDPVAHDQGTTLLFTLEQKNPGGSAIGRLRLSAATLPRPQPDLTQELTIAPGESIPALLEIERAGHDDLVTFSVDNLPHGIIVDNIGLNGVLIPKGESERRIVLTARGWVPETSRYCHAVANQAGRQTSPPVLLHVRKGPGGAEE